jgi:hypothetical protein
VLTLAEKVVVGPWVGAYVCVLPFESVYVIVPAADELLVGLPVSVVSVLIGLPDGYPDPDPLTLPGKEYDPVPVGETVGGVNELLVVVEDDTLVAVEVEEDTLVVVEAPELPTKKDFTFAA